MSYYNLQQPVNRLVSTIQISFPMILLSPLLENVEYSWVDSSWFMVPVSLLAFRAVLDALLSVKLLSFC